MKTLRFEDLSPFLLHENGNRLYKIPLGEDGAVLKIYRGGRSIFEILGKSFAGLLAGQTSYFPKRRREIERRCLNLWEKHGFGTFQPIDDWKIEAPGCPRDYLLTRYVEGTRLIDFLADESKLVSERFEVFREFLNQWGRRHDLAIALSEPDLVHENGDGKHVMVTAEGLIWFDFEIGYRFRSGVAGYVSREIATYLKSLLRAVPSPLRAGLWQETLNHYPNPERLARVGIYFFRHPNPFHRTGRWLDRCFSARAKKHLNKYEVARALSGAFRSAQDGLTSQENRIAPGLQRNRDRCD